VTLGEGVETYLKITGSYSGGVYTHHLGSLVKRLEQDEAEREVLACCRYIAPINKYVQP
jgi:hypothetical protein